MPSKEEKEKRLAERKADNRAFRALSKNLQAGRKVDDIRGGKEVDAEDK